MVSRRSNDWKEWEKNLHNVKVAEMNELIGPFVSLAFVVRLALCHFVIVVREF